MAFERLRHWLYDERRNDALIDVWSGVHFMTGVALGWVVDPFVALLVLVLWEPLEVLVLSPLAQRIWGKEFGFEGLRNVVSDIVVDAAGVAVGYWVLGGLVEPPFVLFG